MLSGVWTQQMRGSDCVLGYILSNALLLGCPLQFKQKAGSPVQMFVNLSEIVFTMELMNGDTFLWVFSSQGLT